MLNAVKGPKARYFKYCRYPLCLILYIARERQIRTFLFLFLFLFLFIICSVCIFLLSHADIAQVLTFFIIAVSLLIDDLLQNTPNYCIVCSHTWRLIFWTYQASNRFSSSPVMTIHKCRNFSVKNHVLWCLLSFPLPHPSPFSLSIVSTSKQSLFPSTTHSLFSGHL